MSIRVLVAFAALALPPAPSAAHEARPSGMSVYEAVTGEDTGEERNRWDAIYNTQTYVFGRDPSEFLAKHVASLPVGRVLDIAMGEGRNAVYLAKKGFDVEGVDISEVAMRKARRLARENHVSIRTINADLNDYEIKADRYDVIVNINFLLRNLVPKIRRGLKGGGIVVFENYTVDHLKNPAGQSMPRAYLLERDELRGWFKDYEILVYEEINDGKEAKARLIARKPAATVSSERSERQ